jgi:NADPH-dependent glutamate synthase beta subunit-like oxidoreductase
LVIEQPQEFLVQPVDASWLQCNIECQEACPVGTNCRGYLNLAAEGRFEEGYILSRDPNPVAAMCSYVCSAPCERACRRGDIDRPLAIRAMKRFLGRVARGVGHPDVMPQITPRESGSPSSAPGRPVWPVARELATKGYQVTVFDSLPYAGGTMLIGVPAFRLPARGRSRWTSVSSRRLGVRFVYDTTIGVDITFEDSARLRQHRHHRWRDGRGRARHPGRDLEGVDYGVDFMKKANLGQPLVGRRGRRRHRWRLHRDGLLADEPPPRRRARLDRLPPDAVRARRRRGGARRDRARGRPDGVPRQPVEVLGENGKVTGVKFIRNKLGEPDASGRRSPVPIEGSEFVIPARRSSRPCRRPPT